MSMQDVTVVTTSTGSTYEFVENFCLKNQQHIMKIWDMKSGVGVYTPWEPNPSWKDVTCPEVGKNLFVSGREGWYCTTPVVSVEVVRKEYPIS